MGPSEIIIINVLSGDSDGSISHEKVVNIWGKPSGSATDYSKISSLTDLIAIKNLSCQVAHCVTSVCRIPQCDGVKVAGLQKIAALIRHTGTNYEYLTLQTKLIDCA